MKKLCSECHFYEKHHYKFMVTPAMCTRIRSVIDDRVINKCVDERCRNGSRCGKDGKFWKERIIPPTLWDNIKAWMKGA